MPKPLLTDFGINLALILVWHLTYIGNLRSKIDQNRINSGAFLEKLPLHLLPLQVGKAEFVPASLQVWKEWLQRFFPT